MFSFEIIEKLFEIKTPGIPGIRERPRHSIAAAGVAEKKQAYKTFCN